MPSPTTSTADDGEQLERATADMLNVLERIISRRGDDAATIPSVREHCCARGGVLMCKAFVIGLPVREAYTGTTIELCHELTYDDTNRRGWKKYMYSEEEAREDEEADVAEEGGRLAVIDLLDVGPLDQQEREALHATRNRLCSLFPGKVRMRQI